MNARQPNILFLFSDEHDPRHMGVSGSPQAKTPNLDRLARRGTRFTNAYTPCPICVPARASLATGLPVHETGYWDNALGYDGRIKGWGHALQAAGHRVESIGKLHYLNDELPTGFDKQHMPMHLWQGIGQVWASVRDPLPETPWNGQLLKNTGPGWSNYNQFDSDVASTAVEWLKARAVNPDDKPWTLYTGFVAPHFPLIAPQEYFDLYPLDAIEVPKMQPEDGYSLHPWVKTLGDYLNQERFFQEEPDHRKLCIAGYLALCSFVDDKIGEVLRALEETGLADNTIVIYASDHGDNLGARGLWNKSTFYRESAAIPMILSGPNVPAEGVNHTPVTLTDLHSTILDIAGVDDLNDGFERPSRSLISLLGSSDVTRTVLSQYHAFGATTGGYMTADARWKYHYYVGYSPELFNLQHDPEETTNLAQDPAHTQTLKHMHNELLRHLGGRTPEQIDRMAKNDQNALIERFGGRERALKSGTPSATPVPGKTHE